MSAPTTTPQNAGPDADLPPVIPSPSGRARWPWLLAAIVLLAALAVLFALNPSHHAVYPVCFFYRATGYQCPGCGGLRSVHHLLHGEIGTAFRFNQLVVLSVPVLVWLGARRLRCGAASACVLFPRKVVWGWAIFIVLVVFWIVRNLPIEFFRLPVE